MRLSTEIEFPDGAGATGDIWRTVRQMVRNLEGKQAKRSGNRTDVDDQRLRQLECQRSLYLNADGRPTVPAAAGRPAPR